MTGNDHKPLDASNLMPQVLTYLDIAYRYICDASCDLSYHHEIWHVRHHWAKIRPIVCDRLLHGNYAFSEAKAYQVDQHSVSVWCVLDRIVAKALSLFFEDWLYPQVGVGSCYHVKGKGIKRAISALCGLTKQYVYAFKTDIKSYYASIDHHRVQEIFARWIDDKRILRLLWQYCDCIEDVGGVLVSQTHGIPKGGPLSIVIGTMYLIDLDQMKRPSQTRYMRDMDDIIFLCNKWHRLRQCIKQVYRLLEVCGLTLAPSKTFIGQVKTGFDFLGYHMGSKRDSVEVSTTSYQRLKQRLKRLYELRVSNTRVLAVVKHWCKWATSGLSHIQVILLKHITLTLNDNPDDVSRRIIVPLF